MVRPAHNNKGAGVTWLLTWGNWSHMAAYMGELEPHGCLHGGTGATQLPTQELYSPQCPPRAVAPVPEQNRAKDGRRRTFSPLPSCLATRPLGAALSYTYKESQEYRLTLSHYLGFSPLFQEGVAITTLTLDLVF